jgi:glycosyltransferase involved in cell wall biosynthesis
MKIVCLTRHDELGASSRIRFLQYFQKLSELAPELSISFQGLLDADYLRRKYSGRPTVSAALRCYITRMASGALWAQPDVWWIEKELWPWAPAWLELILLSRRPYVLDLDDAIFHNYDMHQLGVMRMLYGRKIDQLMFGASLVTAGNEYLAQRARRAGAGWVEVLPTVIDLDRYTEPKPKRSRPDGATVEPTVIGWIGSPATRHYLRQLAEPLQQLARELRIELLVIGGGELKMPGVVVQSVPWSPDTEAQSIAQCDIGVMPLSDSPWEQGKCGYKLLQYMACGLPVVASPVGVNTQIVTEGVNGFLAANVAEWSSALGSLVRDPCMRARFGAAGRAKVEGEYSVQANVPRVARWLREVCSTATPARQLTNIKKRPPAAM